MGYEETWEIETRFRILNPREKKDEIFFVFPFNRVIKRYTSRHVDSYLETVLEDPNYFLRLRKIEVSLPSGEKKRLRFLNDKKMLDEKYPPTSMGVRVAHERDFKGLSKDYLKRRIIVKVSGSRRVYEIEGFEVNRDSIDGLGEFIECGVTCKEENEVEALRKKVDEFAKDLFGKLNEVGVKVVVEMKIYPELLSK